MQLSELFILGLGALTLLNPTNIAIYLPILIISIAAIQYKAYQEINE
jgi:hypothetical protein